MNELRMYVEHLFEGKVLTPENIELKEEIYGNLVARYEDLIASGLDESEAIAQTKESMTSIDDVIIENPTDSSSDECDGDDISDVADESGDSHDPDQVDPVASTPHDGPTPITENVAVLHQQPGQSTPRKRTWPFVLACVLIGLLVMGIGFAGCSLMFGIKAFDQYDGEQTEHVENVDASRGEGSSGSGSTAAGNTNPTPTKKNSEIFIDENGQVWVDGELGDELAEEVVNAGYGVVAEYGDTDLADAAKVEALLRSLPMGEYASDVDVTKGVDVLSLAYRELPETLEGDSVDAALAYDVTAVFCAMPLVNEIQITLAESDEPLDESYYVFKRDEVQSRYGVRLDDLLVNEAGWHQIKEDNLYRRKFIENMVDAAEKEWK
ncbi:MAG: hypothetical protein KHY67_06770 [Collinsella intestinalis]|uniref:Uncharacterized protein n=1 Tax=Collinsella intestinalis TaxID=147207 RepID=A0A943BRD3_9ACTN|nr:hypothetical protein [Collinsella intestinalis]